MANRSMVFASKSIPVKSGKPAAVMGLSEYPYAVPLIYQLLVSVDPVLCPSAIWTDAETPVAIAGDAKAGLARLQAIRASLPDTSPNLEDIDAALAFLTQEHLADFPYFLIEPGEIFDMSGEPLADQMSALLSEIQSFDMPTLQKTADAPGEDYDWAGGYWTHILYFEPSGTVQPPILPTDTRLTTDAETLIASKGMLSDCAELAKLSLSFNTPDELADALRAAAALPALTELRLSGRTETLPDEIGALTGLTRLVAGDIGLTTLPESLGQLTQLKGLFLQKNQLTSFPPALTRLTALDRLSIWDNAIGTLPEDISALKNLQVLNVARCDLAALPDGLWALTALQELNIGGNGHLTTVPEAIGNLSALEELQLHSCSFTDLPASLAALKKLKTLNAGYNQITSIPLQVRLMKLETLRLNDNPFKKGLIPFGAEKVHL